MSTRYASLCLAALPLSLVLAACATSSGAQMVGPDTYTISAQAAPLRGGESGARRIAIQEANEHCAGLGRQILVTDMGGAVTNGFGAGTTAVTFQCLAPGDRDLRRPQSNPDVIIQNRR